MGGQLAGGAGFSTFERQDRVLVALSGGVDSAVCVRILQQQGRLRPKERRKWFGLGQGE